MLIKNIIFDMGGVIVDFVPMHFIEKHFPAENAETKQLLFTEIFSGRAWSEFDRGTASLEQTVEFICSRIPASLHDGLRSLVRHVPENMLPKTGMFELVSAIKERGHGIYLLSNTPKTFYDFYERIPAFRFFDGFVISADYLALKPEPEIYRVLFDKFALDPAQCLFIDDLERNIDGARAMGMRGYCFDHGDVRVLRDVLRQEGIL